MMKKLICACLMLALLAPGCLASSVTPPSSSGRRPSQEYYLDTNIGDDRLAMNTGSFTCWNAWASSELVEKYGTYPATNCFDGNARTAWVEGEVGDGIGAEISATWTARRGSWWIIGVAIQAGYQKNDDIYKKNNRPSSVGLTFFVGDIVKIFDADLYDYQGRQCIMLNEWIPMDGDADLFLRFNDVYRGSKYHDTCVSEIDLLVSPR